MLKLIPHHWRHPVRTFLSSSEWIGTLWILIGLGTLYSGINSDLITVTVPMIIGIVCFIPFDRQDKVYYILVFACMCDRILFYISIGAYSLIFVWLLLGTYITRKTR